MLQIVLSIYFSGQGIKAWELHNTPRCPHKGSYSLTVAEANYSEVQQHHQGFVRKLIKDSFIAAEHIKAVFVNAAVMF